MASILIEGTAFDPDGGNMTYEWVVNDQFGQDHTIGTTLMFNWIPFGTVPGNCSPATVQLILTATDEDLDTGSDTIEFSIFWPPC